MLWSQRFALGYVVSSLAWGDWRQQCASSISRLEAVGALLIACAGQGHAVAVPGEGWSVGCIFLDARGYTPGAVCINVKTRRLQSEQFVSLSKQGTYFSAVFRGNAEVTENKGPTFFVVERCIAGDSPICAPLILDANQDSFEATERQGRNWPAGGWLSLGFG
jgi:hypothetical protein